ncbi:MAG: DUF1697 domain-containing protein [Candidatus Eremiobacteraeota bacterium]|nr:DUF1697 domain-containing protein [Candidatus Eremiobacteraeota bacterium]MCW5869696.1 DUF1697 domain-containing protein [Candidatus Eremiobacteraeota bacterium]
MVTYIALLRAINVGGTGKLAMARLRQLCEEAGFASVRSYIQSGNLVLQSSLSEAQVKADLEKLLEKEMGKPYSVFVRTPQELEEVLARNPYEDCQVVFFDQSPTKSLLEKVVAPDGEELSLGEREVYVYYPNGLGKSRLKAPGLKDGTARNLNTLRKLLEMAEN